MNDYQNRVLECALEYIKLGWKILPLHTIRNGQCTCGKANCTSAGKHPSTANGCKDASNDEAAIRQWFGNGIAFNIGIATGLASGLVVLDIDPRHGGDESIRQFDIPPTLEVITGSGGRHYYFTIPQGIEIRNSQGTLAAGIDVRGEGGYIVAPPSVHVCGNDYRWNTDSKATPLAECPKWIYEKGDRYNTSSGRNATSPQKTPRIPGNSQQDDEIISEGQRNGQLTSIAGAMRRQGCDHEEIFATLININERRCKPPLDYKELYKIAASIAQYQPNPEDGIVLDDDHHVTVAQAFEAASPTKHRHQTETWIVVQDKKYQLIDERELKKQLRNYANECKYRKRVRCEGGFTIQNERLKVTPQLINGIMEALAALESVWLSPEIHSPCWVSIGHITAARNQSESTSQSDITATKLDTYPDPEYIIPVQNCLLDISGSEPRILDLTEEFFAFNYLPIVYNPKADCPQWKTFLGQIFQSKRLSSEKTEWDSEAGDFVEVPEIVPDELSISILQEFLGLLLTQITRFQKILGIVGPKRSGKGTIGRIIRALVGKDNIGSPTLTGMTNEHGLQGLYHKTVALISDASISGGNADTIRAVERLKSISGEDSQQINPKCKAYIEVDRLKVRFVIMSNELQKLTDPTGALAGRFIYLITTQSFFGKEDVRLEEKLLAEIPGIFNWAIEGLMRLLKRGHFLESEAGLDAKKMAEELGSPVIAFVREYCQVGANRQIRSQELYDAYKRWCNEAGRSQMGRNRFYEEFQRAFPECCRSKIRQDNIGTSPVWVYENIGLLAEYRAAGF